MPNPRWQDTLSAPVRTHGGRQADPSARRLFSWRASASCNARRRGLRGAPVSEDPCERGECQKANACHQHWLRGKVPPPVSCLRDPGTMNESASPEACPRLVPGRHGTPWAAPLLIGLVPLLASCGGETIREAVGDRGLPLQTALHAHQAPLVDLGDRLHVGADVAAADGDLPVVAVHGSVDVSHGTVRDGIGAAEIVAYLRADAASYLAPDDDPMASDAFLSDGLVFRFAETPPTVRVAEGTPAGLVDETVRVVQAINAALPRHWQLRFSPEPAPAVMPAPPDGEILVNFVAQATWPSESDPVVDPDLGLAVPEYAFAPTGDPQAPVRLEIVAGTVWVDPSRTEGLERLGVIAHELMHLLGRSHVDPGRFPETLMVAGGSESLTGHVLHPLDREALHAVYGRLSTSAAPDRIAEELGPWSDTSLHVQGRSGAGDGETVFGTALRNGLAQPWANGPAPASGPGDNAALSASVRWSGRLLGLTPRSETVAGIAELVVDFPNMSGTLDFSGLERWPASAAPGSEGSGSTWRDGRLGYQVTVRGNTFVQSGGDAGLVTGAFFGTSHEGMGGVLVREDLSAGFGGTR